MPNIEPRARPQGCHIQHAVRCLLQMAEVLQMLSREHDSETGSITDSGRGPSEEGDNNRPSPLDPHLNDDHKGESTK